MTRAVVALATLLVASHVHAHGLVPAPQSIIASDAHGVRAVRLTEGLALRVGDGFEYVCPAAWGGTYALVLAAAMPDGAIAIATGSGIAVRGEDGTFAAHPDPLASGQVIAFAATSRTLYALHRRDSATELIAYGAGKPQRAYADSVAWNDVAATDDELLLLRFDGSDVHELRLSTSGEMLGGENAPAPETTAAVFARMAGSTAYVVATVNGGLALDLGRIEDGAFHVLQTAGANLAGPLDSADGHRFVAIDGVLSRFDGERVDEIGEDAIVTFLGRDGKRSYACTRSEIRALEADGLGATLFDITQLRDPDLSVVPEPLRSECGAQWDHFRFDLIASGVTLRSESDAGEATHAATPSDAGARRDSGEAGMKERPAASRSSGCSVAAAHFDLVQSLALAVLALAIRRQPRRR